MNVASVFCGIGACEHALTKLCIEHNIIFASDNGGRKCTYNAIGSNLDRLSNAERNKIIAEEYNKFGKNYVELSYLANYSPLSFFQDVRFVDGKEYRDRIELFVGGSPCQSFSQSGKRLGLEDARGTLFYEYARLVNEIKPDVFIYENVPGIMTHDNGKTWEIMSEIFDDLGYYWKVEKLNAKDYGIPQNRRRIFVVGFKKSQYCEKFRFPKKIPLNFVAEDFLESCIDKKYYFKEKGFKWVTNPKNIGKRVSINAKICRTQTANQQYNWCGDMIFEEVDNSLIHDGIYIDTFCGKPGKLRKLIPRECLNLMGYSKDFKIVVPDKEIYHQSGNSIVVNTLEEIIKQIIKTGVWEKDVKSSDSI